MFKRNQIKKVVTSYTLRVTTFNNTNYNIPCKYTGEDNIVSHYVNSPFKNGELVTSVLILPKDMIKNIEITDYIKKEV